VTAGEPAGIGPELCLALATERLTCDVVVLSDPELLRDRAALTGSAVTVTEVAADELGTRRARSGELLVLAERFPAAIEVGVPNPGNAVALLNGLRSAVEGCRNGRFAGLVTAPLQKSVINDAGIRFSGHTEFLAELMDAPHPVMLLVAADLRVALATTHLPLRDVPDHLTASGLRDVLQTLLDELGTRFGIDNPEIAVCGLNPHAGEGGHLGSEDRDIIAPVAGRHGVHGRQRAQGRDRRDVP
jgi:4-hydroxythreonine-4-phosphate dehydrogenase